MQVKDMDIFRGCWDLYAMFKYFNAIVFNGEIRPLKLSWVSTLRGCAGVCRYRGTQSGIQLAPTEIELSRQLLAYRSEFDVVNVLVHEMIHALLFQRGVFEPGSGHGFVFMSEANRANRYFGLCVTQFHYHIDPAKYAQLDAESKQRVEQSFLGQGVTLSQDEIVDLTGEEELQDCVVDLVDSENDFSVVYSEQGENPSVISLD